MTQTKREQSIYLQALLALKRRTPIEHPKLTFIKEKLRRHLSGYRGECAVDYQLSYLPQKNYSIIRGIRLYNGEHYFQLDTLLITQKFLLNIEAKNHSGEITFDEKNHQMIQEIDGNKKVYQDPLTQIYFQEHNLRKWLAHHNYPNYPILSLVVLTNPSTILHTNSNKVVRNEYLLIKISQLEKSHNETILNDKEVKKLARNIIKHHQPQKPDVLKEFDIKEEELLAGVHCPQCDFLPLVRNHGTWLCPNCNDQHPDAHLSSIKDYSLLITPTFSNKQIRDF